MGWKKSLKKFGKAVLKEIEEEEKRRKQDAKDLLKIREARIRLEAEERAIRRRRGW